MNKEEYKICVKQRYQACCLKFIENLDYIALNIDKEERDEAIETLDKLQSFLQMHYDIINFYYGKLFRILNDEEFEEIAVCECHTRNMLQYVKGALKQLCVWEALSNMEVF